MSVVICSWKLNSEADGTSVCLFMLRKGFSPNQVQENISVLNTDDRKISFNLSLVDVRD
jgi:hypothetical protein